MVADGGHGADTSRGPGLVTGFPGGTEPYPGAGRPTPISWMATIWSYHVLRGLSDFCIAFNGDDEYLGVFPTYKRCRLW